MGTLLETVGAKTDSTLIFTTFLAILAALGRQRDSPERPKEPNDAQNDAKSDPNGSPKWSGPLKA